MSNVPKHQQDYDTDLKKIAIYKEMYKLAQEKRPNRFLIVQKILSLGFQSALLGYIVAKRNKKMKYAALFKKECDTFSKVGKSISRTFGLDSTPHRHWKQKCDNFESYVSSIN